MRRLLLTLFLILGFAGLACAQTYTTVTANVLDPNGTIYILGSYTVSLINNTGQQALLNGNANFQKTYSGLTLTSAGAMSISLPSVTAMTPTGLQWQFNVCANPGQVAAVFPVPTLPCFSYTSTGTLISGSSVNISTQLQAVATVIPLAGGGLSTVTSLPATCTPGTTAPVQLNASPYGAYYCKVTNGWALMGPSTANGFNVQSFGAKGDWQAVFNGGTISSNQTQTCATCNFQPGDVGKTMCGTLSYSTVLACSAITGYTSSSVVTTTASATTSTSGVNFMWGTPDDTAIGNALTAVLAAAKGTNQGNTGVIAATPTLYFPAGGYELCTQAIAFTPGTNSYGFGLIGDGMNQTMIYLEPGCSFGGANAPIFFSSYANTSMIRGFTLNGLQGPDSSVYNVGLMMNGSPTYLSEVEVTNVGLNYAAYFNASDVYADKIFVVGNQSFGLTCQSCTGEFHNWISSNNTVNTYINGVNGGNGQMGAKFYGGLQDECGATVAGCGQVVNSHDVWFIGSSLFSTPGGHCLNVDTNSFVHWDGGLCGVFGTDANAGGVLVQNGGQFQASDVRMISTGTANCMSNSGSFYDNGGNSCERQFTVSSGTSTGTTAVLTSGSGGAPNASCTAGDSLIVQGVNPPGYNGYYPFGVVSVNSTTLTYTSVGSTMGAAGAGGTFTCRNMQSYSGTLPKALLNNPVPNTCNVTISPIVNATTYLMCNLETQTATNVTRIKASSVATTTCSTAPIITISDGTVSETLTLTSGKTQWDSSVDASTGVGTTIFKPNGTVTVKYDAGALSSCTTPPTNLAVSYNVSPILSN
jgi:hypothetical protein